MNEQPIYTHVQTSMWMRVFMVAVAAALLIPGTIALRSGDAGIATIVLVMPLIVAYSAFVFSTMTIQVTATAVRWWCGFGWPGGTIERADLVAEEITSPGMFNGIGIHLTFRGWLWNVSLGSAVALHRNGKLDGMRDVAAETPELASEALTRAKRALASRRQPEPLDRQAARAELDALMDRVGTA